MRTARNAVALGSAVAGVYLLTDVRIEGEPIGVAFAFANAGLFAAYIVLAHRVAQHGRMGGIDGLGAAMLVATVVVTPIGFWSAAPASSIRSPSPPPSVSASPHRSSRTCSTSWRWRD